MATTRTGTETISNHKQEQLFQYIRLRSIFEELLDDSGVSKGGGIPDVLFAKGDFSEYPAHDLAGSSFGESRGVLDDVGGGEGADPLADQFLEGGDEGGVELGALVEGDEAVEGLALDGVRAGDDGGLGHARLLREHALHLGRGHEVPRHVQHVVDAPRHPQQPVLVASRSWTHKLYCLLPLLFVISGR